MRVDHHRSPLCSNERMEERRGKEKKKKEEGRKCVNEDRTRKWQVRVVGCDLREINLNEYM